jgi:hypothetical protein
MDRVLVLPHIGTALGHLIRISEYLRRNKKADYFIAIPKEHLAAAKRFLPDFVKIVLRDKTFSVNSDSGKIDIDSFHSVLSCDYEDYLNIRPDRLLGDPGIRTSLLGSKVGLPWEAITHGCFLPIPSWTKKNKTRMSNIAVLAWNVARNYIDFLIKEGSGGKYTSWSQISLQGKLIVPDWPGQTLPRGISVKKIKRLISDFGRDKGSPFPCIVTTSSGLSSMPPRKIIELLASHFKRVGIVGCKTGPQLKGIEYLNDLYAINSLVDSNTVAIVHGGYGTLGAIADRAGRTLALPQDLDQLCNILIAIKSGINTIEPGLLEKVIEKQRGLRRIPLWPSLEWMERWIIDSDRSKKCAKK